MVFITRANWIVVLRIIFAICCVNLEKHINMLCEQYQEGLNAMALGGYNVLTVRKPERMSSP
jgi:hypothetical protein